MGLVAVALLVVRHLPWLALALAAWELWKLAGEERPPSRSLSRLLAYAPMGLVTGPAILLLGCAAPALFLLLRLAVSRNREFQADATAVALTRDPDALLGALVKLLDDQGHPTALPSSLAPLAIRKIGGFGGWLSTHPPLEERIARLERMGARAPVAAV
jgi:Zn-dependent protease with chaperone function